MTDGALQFLDTVKDKPFYLLVPFFAPHTPYDYQPEQYREPYRNAKFSCFPDLPMHPWQNSGLAKLHGQRDAKHAYSALITGVDHNIGRVLRRLEELKLRDNTLVIFTADQGWNAGHHGVWGKGNGTVPYNLYEESARVPMIWNHPARIRGGRKARTDDFELRLLPHHSRLPGHPGPQGFQAPRPQLRRLPHRATSPPPGATGVFFEYSYVRGMRTENLKYIERTKEWPSELFDLEADPGETRNVIADPAYAKMLAALRAETAEFFRGRGAPPIEEWRSTTKQKLTVYKRHQQ